MCGGYFFPTMRTGAISDKREERKRIFAQERGLLRRRIRRMLAGTNRPPTEISTSVQGLEKYPLPQCGRLMCCLVVET